MTCRTTSRLLVLPPLLLLLLALGDVANGAAGGQGGGGGDTRYDGGWIAGDHYEGAPLHSDVCTIPVVDIAKGGVFNAAMPAVYRGVTDNARFRSMTTRDILVGQHGDAELVLSSANTFSYDKRQSTVRAYIATDMSVPWTSYFDACSHNCTSAADADAAAEAELPALAPPSADSLYYAFGDHHRPELWGFLDAYVRPPWLDATRIGSLSFGLGAHGSGVPFHTHGPVFAEVMYGAKRWFISAPGKAPEFDPNTTTVAWLRERERRSAAGDVGEVSADSREEEEVEILECTLAYGDVLYLPDAWWHATLNIGQTVFISTFV